MRVLSKIECPFCKNLPEKVWENEIGTVYDSSCLECDNDFQVTFIVEDMKVIQTTSED